MVEPEPEDGLTDEERSFLQTHGAAMLACMTGWSSAPVCVVAFNWTFYYLVGLAVAAATSRAHGGVRLQGQGARRPAGSRLMLMKTLRRLDRTLSRSGASRRILVDSRTPVNYEMVAPVVRAMRVDPRIEFSFTASGEPQAIARIYGDADVGTRCISPRRAALARWDAYLTSGTCGELPRGAARIKMFPWGRLHVRGPCPDDRCRMESLLLRPRAALGTSSRPRGPAAAPQSPDAGCRNGLPGYGSLDPARSCAVRSRTTRRPGCTRQVVACVSLNLLACDLANAVQIRQSEREAARPLGICGRILRCRDWVAS